MYGLDLLQPEGVHAQAVVEDPMVPAIPTGCVYAGKSSVFTTEPASIRSISPSTAFFVMFFATVRTALQPRFF